ncbi:MAG: hypothetical protein LBG70_03785, partial [Bifidobacteriaceae bacterium]|nr:hypothetical protein [Bifidobacteriaceae bacterium]
MSKQPSFGQLTAQLALWCLSVMAVFTGLGAWLVGRGGLLAALSGAAVTLLVCGSTALVMWLTWHKTLAVQSAWLVGVWVVKMLILIVAFALLGGQDFINKRWFGLTVLIGLLGALALDARLVLRARQAPQNLAAAIAFLLVLAGLAASPGVGHNAHAAGLTTAQVATQVIKPELTASRTVLRSGQKISFRAVIPLSQGQTVKKAVLVLEKFNGARGKTGRWFSKAKLPVIAVVKGANLVVKQQSRLSERGLFRAHIIVKLTKPA